MLLSLYMIHLNILFSFIIFNNKIYFKLLLKYIEYIYYIKYWTI